MKKQSTEWKCDSCLVSRTDSKESWRPPEGWAEVEVKLDKGQEAIHFCGPCWQDGKSPVKNEALPSLIRRFFGWVVKNDAPESPVR